MGRGEDTWGVMTWGARRPRRRPWRYLVRGILSVCLVAAVACWLYLAFLVNVFRCDEACYGDQDSWWGYPAQLALAAVGSVLAIIAVALGFTSRRTAYWMVLAGAGGCAWVWFVWFFVIGGF